MPKVSNKEACNNLARLYKDSLPVIVRVSSTEMTESTVTT